MAGDPGREAIAAGLDLLFPPFCPVCQERLGPGRRDPLCGTCWGGLERIVPPLCRLCGVPVLGPAAGATGPGPAGAGEGVGPLCGACRREPPPFAYARAAARYEGRARAALHALKFGGCRPLAAPLGDLLAEVARSVRLEDPVLLVPVPLHAARRRGRGFDQAELLAARLAVRCGLPAGSGALVRGTATAPQSELPAEARRANVRGAFRVPRPDAVAGRHILLVDDVLTTGATAGECARQLLGAGARSVGVLTVARTL